MQTSDDWNKSQGLHVSLRTSLLWFSPFIFAPHSHYQTSFSSIMSTANNLYAPFHDAGFKAHDVKIPPPAYDPTLDLTIHALVFEPESPAQHTLLLLHGHPQSNLIWLRAAPKLVAELKGTTRIIIPDLRGHGKSTAVSVERDEKGEYKDEAAKGRYTKREMARDMVELVKAVGGHEKFYILAHDRGAVSTSEPFEQRPRMC